MFCPKCETEYREGFYECADCKVDLVDELETTEQQEYVDYVELVTVLETVDQAKLLVAKSILEGAGIRYFAKGEGLKNIFGWGSIGFGINPLVRAIQIQVTEHDKEEAKVLLEELVE